MRKPWTATVVLGVFGLFALPVLIGGPALMWEMGKGAEVRPFTLFIGALFILALIWLAMFLWTIFRRQGRTRTIMLACVAAVFVTAFVVNQFGPRRAVSVSIDLPSQRSDHRALSGPGDPNDLPLSRNR